MKYIHSQRGFTIVETLVAVTILMVSIAGPLTIANKSFQSAVFAHDQVTASYLAQDAVEYIKNVRDNNVIQSRTNSNFNWLMALDGCAKGSECAVDTIRSSPGGVGNSAASRGIQPCSPSANTCKLYNSSTGYNLDAAQTKTQFSRYFYFSCINNDPCINKDEAKLTVVVTWDNGKITNQVTIENEMFKKI